MTDTPNGTQRPGGTDGPGREPTPEEIGDDLFRRLDTLDDRLQRSQERMIALLDRKLNGSQPGPSDRASGGAAGDRGPRPADEARWAPSAAGVDPAADTVVSAPSSGPNGASELSGRSPLGAEAAVDRVAEPGSMDAWFADGKSSVAVGPALTAPAAVGPASEAATKVVSGRADSTPASPRAGEAARDRLPVPAQPAGLAPYDHGDREPAPLGEPVAAPESEPQPQVVPSGARPAWQSNLITVAAVLVVVVVGLYLVGLF
jgi:hypothetical protein